MAVRLWTFNHWIRFSYRLLLMVLSSAAAVVCIICDFWVNIMYDWSGKICRFDMIFIYYHSMQCKLTVPTTLLFFRDCLGTTASSTWDIFTFFGNQFFIRNSYSDRVHIFLGYCFVNLINVRILSLASMMMMLVFFERVMMTMLIFVKPEWYWKVEWMSFFLSEFESLDCCWTFSLAPDDQYDENYDDQFHQKQWQLLWSKLW